MDGNNPAYRTYDGGCQRGPIQTQAVLTVLPSAPPAGTFRPPYAGSQFKPLLSASALQWDRLPKLPKPAGAPSDERVLRHVERPWIDHILNWTLQHGCATHNMYCYGREIGEVVSEVGLYVLSTRRRNGRSPSASCSSGSTTSGSCRTAGGGRPTAGT